MRPPLEGSHMLDKPVGEEPVRKERVIHPIFKERMGVIIDVFDRLRIVGVFVDAVTHMRVDHVEENLKDISKDPFRGLRSEIRELREAQGCPLLVLSDLLKDPSDCAVPSLHVATSLHRTVLDNFRSVMV
jgi:hypothetical protein